MGCSGSSAKESPVASSSNPNEDAQLNGDTKTSDFSSFLKASGDTIDVPKWKEEQQVEKLTPDQLQQIWGCTGCKSLILSKEFSKEDEFPAGISNLKNLEELDLSENNLETLSLEIFELSNLKKLLLFQNLLTEFPSEMEKLGNLEELNLFNNKIKKVPETINNCTSLVDLNLGDNNFMKLPPIDKLTNLDNLQLQWGKVIKIEGSWATLTNLKTFMASRCRINALPTLPVGSLVSLDIEQNMISSLNEEIKNMSTLEELKLGGNDITELSDDAFTNLTNLVTLTLASNKMKTLPSSIGCLKQLKAIFVENSTIETLPIEMKQLANLKRVNLSKCPINFEDTTTKDVVLTLEEICQGEGGMFWGVDGKVIKADSKKD